MSPELIFSQSIHSNAPVFSLNLISQFRAHHCVSEIHIAFCRVYHFPVSDCELNISSSFLTEQQTKISLQFSTGALTFMAMNISM